MQPKLTHKIFNAGFAPFVTSAAFVFSIIIALNTDIMLFGDTESYIDRCSDLAGISAHRSLGYPLLLKLTANCDKYDLSALLLLQIAAFCITVYTTLRIALTNSLETIASKVSLITTVCFLFSGLVFQWTFASLTEIWNVSGLCLLIYLLMIDNSKRTLASDTGFYLLISLLIILRDANFTLLLLAIYRALSTLGTAKPNVVLNIAGASVCCGTAYWNYSEADVLLRWLVPYLNVFGKRILTDPGATEFFVQYGLPGISDLTVLAGEYAGGFMYDHQHADLRSWQNDFGPMGQAFTEWTLENGKYVYASYLISEAPRSIVAALLELITFENMDGYSSQNWLLSTFYKAFGDTLVQVANISMAMMLLLTLFKFKELNRQTIMKYCLILTTAFAIAFIGTHSDAMETPRHTLSATIMQFLVILDSFRRTWIG